MARIANLISLLGMVVAFVIAIGIALVVLDARETNDIVSTWLDVSRWLTEPFHGMFDLERGREELQTAINWGIGAVVYLVAALVVARLLRSARGFPHTRRRLA
ncbi:MAG TPA: hypothetical protein VHF89_03305 [Solirubrobacteraceae bacterium]|nr:hypothetical protein [Solirubrobacteraceae bacterium]